MIVLDEQLSDPDIAYEFTRWYKGAVIKILDLRPATQVSDDAVTTLLRTARDPTFITINYDDFWHVYPASPHYCLLCLKLKQSAALQAPQLARAVLSLPQYCTKRNRRGCVISWRNGAVDDYCT